MDHFKFIFLINYSIILSLTSGAILPRKLYEVPLEKSAFLQVFKDGTKAQGQLFDPDQFTLFISTFNPYNGQTDPKYFLKGPGKYLTNQIDFANALTVLDTAAFWPNDPDFVEEQVFGYEAIAWPSGFLVPGKTKGMIEIYNFVNLTTQPSINIASLDTGDWYYHRTVWMDMNGDDLIDAVSARFQFPVPGNPARSEFMWFENPGGSLTGGWNQHVLVTDGPDVHFRHIFIQNGVNNKTYDCLFAAEFWNAQLILYCVDNFPGAWADVANLIKVPVDLEAGQAFDCLVGDANNDGRLDLLATVYDPLNNEGFVFVYEIPEDFPNGPFTKHTIAACFIAGETGGDSMSPGSAKYFHRHVSEIGSKPSLMLSGDDDGCHYILTPRSEDLDDWSYSKDLLVNTSGTTSGKFAVDDLDGDGWTDIIAAGYTSGTLYVFTFAP